MRCEACTLYLNDAACFNSCLRKPTEMCGTSGILRTTVTYNRSEVTVRKCSEPERVLALWLWS